MTEHPAESRREWIAGVVTRVYRETWEVDVRLIHGSSAIIRRAKILGHYLPEVHTRERQSKVLVGWSDAYQHGPVAQPVHSAIIPDAEKAAHVFWSEHRGFLIRIREPNHPTTGHVGELEIRTNKGGRLLQLPEKIHVLRRKEHAAGALNLAGSPNSPLKNDPPRDDL